MIKVVEEQGGDWCVMTRTISRKDPDGHHQLKNARSPSFLDAFNRYSIRKKY